MTKSEFFETLKELTESEEDLTEDISLQDLEGWDSLSIVQFIATMDAEYGIAVDSKQLVEAKSVGDLVDLVRDNLDG